MQILTTLLTSAPLMILPADWLGWLGWIGLLAVLLLLLRRWWERPLVLTRQITLELLVLLAALPFATLFLGVILSADFAIARPNLPVEAFAPVMMILGAVPWMLAGSLYGPLAGVLFGGAGGLLLSLWSTHSLFTPLETALLALLFSHAVRQRYRTLPYSILRHPLAAALLVAAAGAGLTILTAFFDIHGSLEVRVDFALANTWPVIVTRSVEILLGGLLCEILGRFVRLTRHVSPELVPSPSEASLQTRFFYTILPLLLVMVVTLVIGDWITAGNAARQMIRDRLSATAHMTAEALPYFFETGQGLIVQMARPELLEMNPTEASAALAEGVSDIPFFRQVYLIDTNRQTTAWYPADVITQARFTEEENTGIELALKYPLRENYVIPPWPGESTAQVSFITSIVDSAGQVRGVLVGRTDLDSNPFTKPVLHSLDALKDLNGEGAILDENQRVLYHSLPELVMTTYSGIVPEEPVFYDDVSPRGTRSLMFYEPVRGSNWGVLLSIPAQQAQQQGLTIAMPLLAVMLIFAILTYLLLRFSLQRMSRSLQVLGEHATQIAEGKLDTPVPVQGDDEIGRLGRSFEVMRRSLSARLEELNRLLMVSQGVAANLEISEAVQSVLQAAMGNGACLARVVLTPEVLLEPQNDHLVAFGTGPASDLYAYLDEQIFEATRQQGALTISGPARGRRLNFSNNQPRPAALMAFPLFHESMYYGVLWTAYDQARIFTEEELRFMTTLAGQAALAAANARLYASAEVGRQRLEAVLASTPEPVLVFDDANRLLLLNPAALQVPGLLLSAVPGRSAREVLNSNEVLELLMQKQPGRLTSREVVLANNKIYFASISPVEAEGRYGGRVCVLQDITHFKELDSMKSEFVATVSHDLRSPLTLMRGYATMLPMVGSLNSDQKTYVNKIIGGVENMARLVNNLLDLGRIEAGVGLKLEIVKVSDLVDQVISALQPQAQQKQIQLTQAVAQTAPEVIRADAALLHQALYNLLENAIKYTPLSGQVHVCAEERDGSLVFSVRDSGIGVAPLDQPRVFEKFYRSGRREAYEHRGSGLGLAIVKSIAERHGGKTWLESQLGKGSTFYLQVPVSPEGRESEKFT